MLDHLYSGTKPDALLDREEENQAQHDRHSVTDRIDIDIFDTAYPRCMAIYKQTAKHQSRPERFCTGSRTYCQPDRKQNRIQYFRPR